MGGLVVVISPDLDVGGFTVRVPDIPAYGEGDTEEEAIADLKDALRDYVEASGLDAARALIDQEAWETYMHDNPFHMLRRVEWDLDDLVRG